MAKAKNIDLSKLDPAARKRVERVIAPRDKRLALLFVKSDVESWERAAHKEKSESLSAWVETTLDVAATGIDDMPAAIRSEIAQAAVARDYPFNRRFNSDKLEYWKRAARSCDATFTLWVERWLNHAAKKVLK